MRDQTELQPR